MAGAITAAIAVEVGTTSQARGPLGANLAVCALLAIPLAMRRRAPLPAALAALTLAVAQTALLTPLVHLTTTLMLLAVPPYAVAAYTARGSTAALGLVLSAAGIVALKGAVPGEGLLSGDLIADGLIVGAAWTAGRVIHRRMLRVRRLAVLEHAMRSARRDRERLEIARQRAEIARELHDVLAHSLTAICLQAGAAQRVWDAQPEQARQALTTVGAVARDALVQLREALALIDRAPADGERADGAVADGDRDLGADLDALVRRSRAPGLTITVRADGAGPPLPGAVRLTAYRVVQEALTNAARHAAPTDVIVEVRRAPGELRLRISDRGRRAGAPAAVLAGAGSGNGLRGMRERVAACGGSLSCEPLASGGFHVSAVLPLLCA